MSIVKVHISALFWRKTSKFFLVGFNWLHRSSAIRPARANALSHGTLVLGIGSRLSTIMERRGNLEVAFSQNFILDQCCRSLSRRRISSVLSRCARLQLDRKWAVGRTRRIRTLPTIKLSLRLSCSLVAPLLHLVVRTVRVRQSRHRRLIADRCFNLCRL